MMKINKKITGLLLCFALLSFAFLSLGGEFLHSQVHDHHHHSEKHGEKPDEESDCPLYQFLIEALFAVVVAFVAVKFKAHYYGFDYYQSIIAKFYYFLPPLRAPPRLF